MTKKELIKALEPYPDNMDIFLAERTSDFGLGLLESVTQKKAWFTEDPSDTKALGMERVIVLSEE